MRVAHIEKPIISSHEPLPDFVSDRINCSTWVVDTPSGEQRHQAYNTICEGGALTVWSFDRLIAAYAPGSWFKAYIAPETNHEK